MQRRHLVLFACGLLFSLPLAQGQEGSQNPNPPAGQYPDSSAGQYSNQSPNQYPNQGGDWGESPMEALGDHASFHTDFTFDKSMLNAFSQTVPEQERPIVAKLRSVTVHSFRYSAPGMYNPGALAAVKRRYDGNGWQHIVSKQGNPHPTGADGGPAPYSRQQPLDPTRTDVWVRMAPHANVDGAVVMVANERNINIVVVDGVISPLDLLHLRGHLGIPQFDGSQIDGGRN